MKNIKIGACDWGLPGNGLYATQIAAEVGLDALSLKIGLYESDYPLTQPEMQKIYLSEQQKYGIEYCAIALNDFDNTDTHADLILKAAAAGKHIFCEKPVDHDVARVRMALDAVKKAGVKMQIGFVRRFDHNHRAVYDAVRAGKIGAPHILRISSRDPQPPTIEYVRRSGGIYYDMMIHDFDMIRFLAGCEATEVYAKGTVLVDPAIGAEGDVDTTIVTLTFENGAIGVIDNSRQAVYGYDQRLEVFGSEGAVQDENDIPNTVVVSRADGTSYGTAYQVMWDRYTQAFIDEMKAFADAVMNDKVPPITDLDGLYPVLMAAAANKSLKEGRPVKISEVDV